MAGFLDWLTGSDPNTAGVDPAKLRSILAGQTMFDPSSMGGLMGALAQGTGQPQASPSALSQGFTPGPATPGAPDRGR